MTLANLREDIYYRCSKCGACRIGYSTAMPSCPSGTKFGFDSYYATGRLDIARGLLNESLEWLDSLSERIFTCLRCGACNELCYPQTAFRPTDVIDEVKKELVKRGFLPQGLIGMSDNIKTYGNPWAIPFDKKSKWLKEKVTTKAKTLFFVGCQASYYLPDIANKTLTLLKDAGVEISVMHNEPCCCAPLLKTGQIEKSKDLIKQNVENIERMGIEEVIFFCPSCYSFFKNEYPKILGRDLGFKLIHRVEYLSRLIEEGRLKPEKKLNIRATYHDPCHLGRLNGIYDAPRRIFSNVSGLKMVEMQRNKESAWCCGGGGMVTVSYPEFSGWTASERLKEANQTGAQALIVACPGCFLSFKKAASFLEKKPNILDIVNFF